MNEKTFPIIEYFLPQNIPHAVLINRNGKWRKGYLCKCLYEVKKKGQKKCENCGKTIEWENPW